MDLRPSLSGSPRLLVGPAYSFTRSFAKLTGSPHSSIQSAAMKFPLAKSPFPTLLLSQEDKRGLEAVAEVVVKTNLQQYHELLTVHNGVVDECRWKKTKQRDDICVAPSVSSSSSSSASTTDTSETTAELKDLSKMLTFGSITGNLDDIMYGFLCPSCEDLQLKSAYVGDGFVDWAVLASIIKSSTQDPFRDLSIKWTVKGHSLLIGAVMRARDVVVIESVGIAVTPDGERIGYHPHHLVDIPEIRDLHELQIVRAKVSFCQFFRHRKENCVEVYIHGVINPMGGAIASITTATTAELSVSLRKQAHFAEMKKLTRVLSATSQSTSMTAVAVPSDHKCTVCSQSVSGSGISFSSSSSSKEKRCCRICSAHTCSRCRVSKTVYLPTKKIEKEVSETSVDVCTRCILRVSCASSATFAKFDALAGNGEIVDYTEAL